MSFLGKYDPCPFYFTDLPIPQCFIEGYKLKNCKVILHPDSDSPKGDESVNSMDPFSPLPLQHPLSLLPIDSLFFSLLCDTFQHKFLTIAIIYSCYAGETYDKRRINKSQHISTTSLTTLSYWILRLLYFLADKGFVFILYMYIYDLASDNVTTCFFELLKVYENWSGLNEYYCIEKSAILPLEFTEEGTESDKVLQILSNRWYRDEIVVNSLGLQDLRKWFDIVNQEHIRSYALRRKLKTWSATSKESIPELLKSIVTPLPISPYYPYPQPPHLFSLPGSYFLWNIFLSSFIFIIHSTLYETDARNAHPLHALAFYTKQSSLLADYCCGLVPESVVIGERKKEDNFQFRLIYVFKIVVIC
jgi:hypothetical protein